MYTHLFGPVPSRRLGMSLGIDLVPKKVCSLNCVYCEVGKTDKLTIKQDEYISEKEVKTELLDYFKNNPDPDTFTFSGSGEPTLNSKIGNIVAFLKEHKPHVNVAILTNGTLLHLATLREAIVDADIVLPSLDAVSAAAFQKINRPCPAIDIHDYIEGIIAFRELQLEREKQDGHKRRMDLEIFILPAYNDSKAELDLFKTTIQKIKPTSVQLNTLDRPGAVKHLVSASRIKLEEIVKYWGLDNVIIISAAPNRKKIQSYKGDIEKAIQEMISRRPCTLDDLSRSLGHHISEINKYLDVLESEGIITRKEEDRGTFYQLNNKGIDEEA